jgi:Flp pilus assembly protein TadB
MNEQQAIKQNLNVILHMLAGVALAAVAIVPVLLLKMSAVPAAIYNALVFALLLWLFAKRSRTKTARKLINMDA